MSYEHLTWLHLATVLPAIAIGTYLLLRRKGTPGHKRLGRVYLVLMVMTAVIVLFMQAKVGPLFLGHFGYIHLLSVLTLFSAPRAYYAARRGNIRAHRLHMVGLYLGANVVAGAFTLMPGRFIHQLLFA